MLNAKKMIEAGIKPGALFGRIMKSCQTIDEALAMWEKHQEQKSKDAIEGKKIVDGSFWHWLVNNQCFHGLPSREFPKANHLVQFPIFDLVLFPNSKNKVTMV